MSEDHDEDMSPNYEVGYGKPPKSGQFQKGNKRSSGRPRKSRNLKEYVKEALGATVTARINGVPQKMTKMELGVHQLATKAGQGDPKAISQALALHERYVPSDEREEIPEDETAYDMETLIYMLQMTGQMNDE